MEDRPHHELRRRCERLKWARLRAPGEFSTVEGVAAAVHRDASTIYGWESERKELRDLETLLALSFLYNISFPWLAFGMGEPCPALAAIGEDVMISFWRSCTPNVQRAIHQLCVSVKEELMKHHHADHAPAGHDDKTTP